MIRQVVVREELADVLRPYVEQHTLGEVYVRVGFKLSSSTWLQPDVSFIRNTQLERTDPDGYFECSPAIAIEMASDSNTAGQLDRIIEQYFAHGSEEVWAVYPETRKIRIHFPDGTSRTAGDELKSAALPGWSVGISTIFEA